MRDEWRPQRADFLVTRTITTRWQDEDIYGHVNNVVYFSYFDTAVNSYLMASTRVDTRQLDSVGVVAESGCTFHRELRFPDDVHIGIAVARIGRSSVDYRLAIFQGTTNDAAATGRFVHVYVDAASRQVVPIPDTIRDVLLPLFQSREPSA